MVHNKLLPIFNITPFLMICPAFLEKALTITFCFDLKYTIIVQFLLHTTQFFFFIFGLKFEFVITMAQFYHFPLSLM